MVLIFPVNWTTFLLSSECIKTNGIDVTIPSLYIIVSFLDGVSSHRLYCYLSFMFVADCSIHVVDIYTLHISNASSSSTTLLSKKLCCQHLFRYILIFCQVYCRLSTHFYCDQDRFLTTFIPSNQI